MSVEKINNNITFQNNMSLISKNETFKKTVLINSFTLQTFHRTSSITKYTSKVSIAFVIASPICVLSVCSNRGLEKNMGDLYYDYRGT